MYKGFDRKSAIVTGGASGIGAAVAIRLSNEGAKVAIADINFEGARSLASELPGAIAVDMDVTNVDSIHNALKIINQSLGTISILVNCAGWDRIHPFWDTNPEFWDKVIKINLFGCIAVTHAVLPQMMEQRQGKIVNIASDAGRVGSSGEAVYSAAKGGVIAFTKTLARELAPYNITVNSVSPGPTQTPLLSSITGEGPDAKKIIDAMVKAVPLKRLAQPEEVAAAVAFLASGDASYITGQTLSVSGGLTMI